MDSVTSMGWQKMFLQKTFSFSEINSLTSLLSITQPYENLRCNVVLNLFMYISIILYLYIYVYSALIYHYCVSNILQRINTVNKIRWYKQLFLNFVFEQNRI